MNNRTDVYISCSGERSDGTGSGYTWLQPATGKKIVKRIDSLTSIRAHHYALRSVVKHLPAGSQAVIFTDLELLANQFKGRWNVHEARLQRLLARIQSLIVSRQLKIEVEWLAGKTNYATPLRDRDLRLALPAVSKSQNRVRVTP